jgi:hypothetical protein
MKKSIPGSEIYQELLKLSRQLADEISKNSSWVESIEAVSEALQVMPMENEGNLKAYFDQFFSLAYNRIIVLQTKFEELYPDYYPFEDRNLRFDIEDNHKVEEERLSTIFGDYENFDQGIDIFNNFKFSTIDPNWKFEVELIKSRRNNFLGIELAKQYMSMTDLLNDKKKTTKGLSFLYHNIPVTVVLSATDILAEFKNLFWNQIKGEKFTDFFIKVEIFDNPINKDLKTVNLTYASNIGVYKTKILQIILKITKIDRLPIHASFLVKNTLNFLKKTFREVWTPEIAARYFQLSAERDRIILIGQSIQNPSPFQPPNGSKFDKKMSLKTRRINEIVIERIDEEDWSSE